MFGNKVGWTVLSQLHISTVHCTVLCQASGWQYYILLILSMVSFLSFGALHFQNKSYGSFLPTETDSELYSDSDSKPYCYIVLCTTFSTGSDSDSDPCTDSFLNGYPF